MNNTFGVRLRQLRMERGLNQQELADLLGWPVSKIQDIEEGSTKTLPRYEFCELGLVLEAKPYYLEWGLRTLGRRIRKVVRESYELAENILKHAVRRRLQRNDFSLLWTKILEPPSPMAHRGVLSLSDIEGYHERFLGPLPPLAADSAQGDGVCYCDTPDWWLRAPGTRCPQCGHFFEE